MLLLEVLNSRVSLRGCGAILQLRMFFFIFYLWSFPIRECFLILELFRLDSGKSLF